MSAPLPAPALFFDDTPVGWGFCAGPMLVTAEDIIGFAEQFDPQPFHLDDAAARDTLLGGLAASGWHTSAIGMRLIFDGFLSRAASLGAPGIEEVRWLRPVRPGDCLTLTGRVVDTRPSRSRPDRGIVGFAFELATQDGAVVMTQRNSIILGRRPGDPG